MFIYIKVRTSTKDLFFSEELDLIMQMVMVGGVAQLSYFTLSNQSFIITTPGEHKQFKRCLYITKIDRKTQ